MSATALAQDFIRSLEELNSADDVRTAFEKLTARLGFSFYCFGSMKPQSGERGLVWAASRKSGWFRHWVQRKHYNADPVIWQIERSAQPFRWTSVRSKEGVRGWEMMDEAREFGLRDGWAVGFGFTDPNAPTIALSLGAERYELSRGDETALHLATVYCGLRFSQLGFPCAAQNNTLSERERECLKWVAVGKTDWDISEILGISHQTVHKHVSNALNKLNAGTRAQAVAIALATRQITL